MLKVTEKSSLWEKFVNNIEKHGEDDLSAFDIPGSLELEAAELNALWEDKRFHERLYDKGGRGKPATIGDGFRKASPLKFRDSFEDCVVDVILSNKSEHHFEGCKISRIVCTLCHGGSTEMTYMLHVRPQNDRQMCLLMHHQRRSVVLSIRSGKQVSAAKAQQELGLTPQEEHDDDDAAGNGKDPRPIGGTEATV